MNESNRIVMRKILYAVETGGQVYGQQDYSDFTEAYTNSDAEHAITIGAGQWYATEAKRLLMLIRQTYPERFDALDTAGIGKDLDTAVWSTYKLSKTSEKAKCIQKIISSPEGIKCQDTLMEQQIQEYDQKITKQYGSMPDGALMECINIIHQGGSGALKRILAKTAKPYTADTIYAALCTDPADKSNNNQVGDYTTRQKKVYEMIKKYCVEDMEHEGVTAEDVLNVMRSWLGYSEANGKYKEIIDLYNSHKPLARGYAVQYDDEWCDTTVSAAAIKAGAVDLIGTECGCEEHVKIFKKLGIWQEDGTVIPEPGWPILYNWGQSSQPNDGYSDHIGYVEYVSNGQITCIEGNKGEAVARRVLSVGNGNIRGYAMPKYSSSGSSNSPDLPSASEESEINRSVLWYGYVNATELNVRSWAGTAYGRLQSYPSIKQGTKVGVCDTVLDADGDPWYYVVISGNQGDKHGFVSATYISQQPSGQSDISADDGVLSREPQWVGKVTASILNVRSWAGTNHSIIKSWPQLAKGNLVDVCDSLYADDGSLWYYIRIAGKIYGFVHSSYLTRQ